MGNIGGRFNCFRNSFLGPNCEWLTTSYFACIPVFITRVIVFFFWVLLQVLLFIATLFFVIWRFGEQFLGTTEIPVIGVPIPTGPIFLFVYSGIILFLLWFLFPTLIPYFRDILVPFLNLFLELFCFAWNLAILLINLAVQIWDALAQLIGMIIYIIMDVFTTMFVEVFNLLGSFNIFKIFKPFMEILQFLVHILTEMVQAIVTVAVSLIQILVKVIGVIIKIVMEAMNIILPIVQWVIGLLFKLLEPVLEVVIDVVGWFVSFIAAMQFAAAQANRLLLGLGDAPSLDSFQYQMYADVNHATNKYWTPAGLSTAKKELGLMNEHSFRHPMKSYDYYWTIIHPGYAASVMFQGYPDAYLGESYSLPHGGGRRLLEEGKARGLLSVEEFEELNKPPLEWDDSMWNRYDNDPSGTHDWFHQQTIHHTFRKQEIAERVSRQLLELERTNDTANGTMTEAEWYAERHKRVEAQRNKPHRFADKMDKKIECKSPVCGGHGTPLEFPIHGFRRKVAQRMNRPTGSEWKEHEQTEEEYHDERFIHGTAWVSAVRSGADKLFDHHMKDKRLHDAAQTAFKGVTGHDSAQSALEKFYYSYSDSYHLIHDWIPALHESPVFSYFAKQDPDKDTRLWYGDWLKTVRTKERIHKETGRKILTVELDPINDENHRKLLEVAEYDWQAEVVDTGDTSEYQYTYTSRKTLSVLSGFSVNSQGGQFPSNPPVVVANQSAQRSNIDARTNSGGALPLFDLLTQTNCIDSNPRNPLCLPKIPQFFVIGTCLVIVWPAAATGEDFCDYLFCSSPRDLLNWRAYISWCRIWNGIKWFLIFLSFFPLFTTTLGIIIERFPWLGWAVKWILVLPPGHKASGVDIVCMFMHLYDAWLDIFITYLLWLLVFPFMEYFVALYIALTGLYESYSMIDQQRAEKFAETSMTMSQLAFDSRLNRGETYYGDSSAYRYQRGKDELYQYGLWMGREKFGGNSGPGPAPGMASWLPENAQSPFERFESSNPYVMNQEGDKMTIPWLETYQDRNTPNQQASNDADDDDDDDDKQTLIGAELGFTSNRQQKPPPPPPPKTPEEIEYERQVYETEQAISRLERLIQQGALMFGIPRVEYTYGDLARFEHAHKYYLHPFQFSLWWMVQRVNFIRKQRKIRHHYTPINGAYRVGFTSWWKDRTKAPRRQNSPEEIV